MASIDLLKYTVDDKRRILEKYGTTVERVGGDVKCVREWLKSQPHLPEVLDDNIIERFLLLNKFRIEITKQKIDGYYSIRSLLPEFYNKSPNGEEIRKVTEMLDYVPLPKLTDEFNRVVVMRPKDLTSDTMDAVTFLAHTYNFAEIRLRHDYFYKDVHIYDLKGVRMTHLTKFTPTVIKKTVLILERVFSTKTAGLHFINVPSFIDSFMVLLKSVLKPKVANMVFVHKGVESLTEIISMDVLPEEYGGNERSLNELSDEWRKIFRDNDGLFRHLSELRVKEELRQKPLFDADELFGIQGNFKQLDID